MLQGPEGVVKWIKSQKKLLFTDTTMRDAQQSLMATRVRIRICKDCKSYCSLWRRFIFS